MQNNYLNLSNQSDLIDGVILRKLIFHKDESGSLVETLRSDWSDVFDSNDLSFAMQYLSITPSGAIRDKGSWHVHKFQKDRFVCVSGRIVTALYDAREKSKTFKMTNLFIQGSDNQDEMFMIVIPQQVYHGFAVVSKNAGYLLNFPTQLYNPQDEGRVANSHLDWDSVMRDFQQ